MAHAKDDITKHRIVYNISEGWANYVPIGDAIHPPEGAEIYPDTTKKKVTDKAKALNVIIATKPE